MSDDSPIPGPPHTPASAAPNPPPPPDPNRSYADFWAPIACKMEFPNPDSARAPGGEGGGMGHSGADWDFSRTDALTEIQIRSIELTIQGLSDIKIAQRLQINRKTLWRWKTLDPGYRVILPRYRIQFHATAIDRYQRLLCRASNILGKMMRHADDSRRFPAALAVLHMAGAFKPLPTSHYTIPPHEPQFEPVDPDPMLPPPKTG